jgi:uncharacterized membrane protein YphA (DoxX/SURF4 family)
MFALIFPALALAGAVVQLLVEKRPRTKSRILEVVLLWMLAVGVGATGVFAWSGHIFRAAEVAESIGFPPDNPFQWEVGWANLAVGVLGILCIWRRDFWWPTAIAAAVYLWGAAWGHIYQAVEHDNHKAYNTGPILYTDILVPLVILILLYVYHRSREAQSSESLATA